MNDALTGGMRPRDEYLRHTSAPVSSQELCQGENPNIAAAVSISEQDANIFIILHTRFVTGNESEKDLNTQGILKLISVSHCICFKNRFKQTL